VKLTVNSENVAKCTYFRRSTRLTTLMLLTSPSRRGWQRRRNVWIINYDGIIRCTGWKFHRILS